MSGFAYDTSTATIRITLPDGEVVEVTGANDGVNGYEWSARMVGSGLVLLVTVEEHVLIDGINDPEDETPASACPRCRQPVGEDECLCSNCGYDTCDDGRA